MRSWLFVPADSEKKLAKAASAGADIVILDLEDSVAPERKAAARGIAQDWLISWKAGPRVCVRINALDTPWCDEDLAAVMAGRPDAIMLPKAEGAPSIERLSTMMRVHEAEAGLPDMSVAIAAIITETPAGIFAAPTLRAGLPRLSMVTWGAEDLSAIVGSLAQRDDAGLYTALYAHARTTALLAASNAGVAAIDTIFADFRNTPALERECADAARDGFIGKMAIHPDQVPVINAAFTPSNEAVAEAEAIVAAFAADPDAGVVSVDGKMRDRPHLVRALRLLARANGGQGA